jgi:hypothetical protein
MELVNDVAHEPATYRGVVNEGIPCGPARADLCRHELRGRHLHGGCVEQGHGAFMQEAVADLPFIVDQHRASQPQPRLPIWGTPVRVNGAELQQHGQGGQWTRAAAPSTGRSLRVGGTPDRGPRDQPARPGIKEEFRRPHCGLGTVTARLQILYWLASARRAA